MNGAEREAPESPQVMINCSQDVGELLYTGELPTASQLGQSINSATDGIVRKSRALESLMAYEELIQSLDATVDEGRESLGQAGAFKSMETVAPSALVMDTLPKEPLMLLKYATDTVLQQFSHLQREFMDQKARNDKASQEILELQNVSRELSSFKEQHAMEVDSISHSLRAQAKEESSKLREKIEQLKAEMEESVSKKKELEEQIQLLTMQESDTDESFEALLSQLEENDITINLLRKINKTLQDQLKLSFGRTDESRMELEDALAQAKEEITEDEVLMDEMEEEHEVEVGAFLKIVSSLRGEIRAAFASRRELDKNMAELRTENDTLLKQVNDLIAGMQKRDLQTLDLVAENEVLKSFNDIFRENLKESAEGQTESLLAQTNDWQAQLQEKDTLLSSKDQEIHSKASHIADLLSQVELLQQQMRQQELDFSVRLSGRESELQSSLSEQFAQKVQSQEAEFSLTLGSLQTEIQELKEEAQLKESRYMENLESIERSSQDRNEAVAREFSEKSIQIEQLENQLKTKIEEWASEKEELLALIDQTALALSSAHDDSAKELEASTTQLQEATAKIKELEESLHFLQEQLVSSQNESGDVERLAQDLEVLRNERESWAQTELELTHLKDAFSKQTEQLAGVQEKLQVAETAVAENLEVQARFQRDIQSLTAEKENLVSEFSAKETGLQNELALKCSVVEELEKSSSEKSQDMLKKLNAAEQLEEVTSKERDEIKSLLDAKVAELSVVSTSTETQIKELSDKYSDLEKQHAAVCLERDAFKASIDDMSSEIEALQEELHSHKQEASLNLESLEEQLSVAITEREGLQRSLDATQDEFEELSKIHAEQSHQEQGLKAQISELEARVLQMTEDFNIQNQQLLSERSELQATIEKLQESLSSSVSDKEKLDSTLLELQSDLSKLKKGEMTLAQSLDELRSSLVIEKDSRKAAEAQSEYLKEKVTSAVSERTDLLSKIEGLQAEKNDLSSLLEQSKLATVKAEEQVQFLFEQVGQLQEDVQVKEARLADILTNASKEQQVLQVELSAATQEIKTLSVDRDDAVATLASLKSELEEVTIKLQGLETQHQVNLEERMVIKAHLKTSQKAEEELKSQLASQSLQISSLTNEVALGRTLQEVTTALKDEIGRLQSQISQLFTENEEATKEHAKQVKKAEQTIKSFETQKTELITKVQELQNVVKDLQSGLAAARQDKDRIAKELLAEKEARQKEMDALTKSAPSLRDLPSSQSAKSKRVLELNTAVNAATPQSKRAKNTETPRSALKQTSSNNSIGTPAVDLSGKKILICFSGFKESTAFNSELKAKLVKAVEKLPDAAILSGVTDDYDPRTTHVIAPPSSRTLKTFAASLKSAWLIYDPAWILKSLEKGRWLPETGFGHRFDKNPFQGKKYYLAPSFSSCPPNQQFRSRYLKYLISDCANGTFVKTPQEADIVFRGDQDKETYGKAPTLDWAKFVSRIPQVSL